MCERRKRAQLSCVSEERIEPFPAFEDGSAETIEGWEVSDVEWHQCGTAAERFDLIVCFFETTDSSRDEDYMRAGSSERERCSAANAPRRPGDEGHAPVE